MLSVQSVTEYRISELAARSGLLASTLRYDEQVGVLAPAARTPEGYRVYDDAALARIDGIWQAAALGLTDRVEQLLAADPAPSAGDIDEAFWQACHGGQLRTAALLLSRGADINAHPQLQRSAGRADRRRDRRSS